jgi:hypothetical protein
MMEPPTSSGWVAKVKFCKMAMKMLLGAVVIDTLHAALEDRKTPSMVLGNYGDRELRGQGITGTGTQLYN